MYKLSESEFIKGRVENGLFGFKFQYKSRIVGCLQEFCEIYFLEKFEETKIRKQNPVN